MSTNVGKIISDRLKDLKKTQGWLAEKTGVSVNAVSVWTRTGKISRENAVKAAGYLGLSLDQLLGTEDPHLHLVPKAQSRLDRLDEMEDALIQLFRSASDSGQTMIFAQAKLVAEQMPRSITRSNHES